MRCIVGDEAIPDPLSWGLLRFTRNDRNAKLWPPTLAFSMMSSGQ